MVKLNYKLLLLNNRLFCLPIRRATNYRSIVQFGKLSSPYFKYLNNASCMHKRYLATNTTTSGVETKKEDFFSTSFDYEVLSSSSDTDNKNKQNNESLIRDMDILQKPTRERFGITKAILIIVIGVYTGAWVAMVGANVLEELEIFIDYDDD